MPVRSASRVRPALRPGGEGLTAADARQGILKLYEARDGLAAPIRLPGGYAGAAVNALVSRAE
ncbi:MAG TPA: hypothetical protein VMC03_08925 [Streptosporangiaceae bacterium]|nr:hypothetical protein [Streptosporangiaceae bacterium]